MAVSDCNMSGVSCILKIRVVVSHVHAVCVSSPSQESHCQRVVFPTSKSGSAPTGYHAGIATGMKQVSSPTSCASCKHQLSMRK